MIDLLMFLGLIFLCIGVIAQSVAIHFLNNRIDRLERGA